MLHWSQEYSQKSSFFFKGRELIVKLVQDNSHSFNEKKTNQFIKLFQEYSQKKEVLFLRKGREKKRIKFFKSN